MKLFDRLPRLGPVRCLTLEATPEAPDARLPNEEGSSESCLLSLICVRVAGRKLEPFFHEHQGVCARRFHPLSESNGRAFEDERAAGRAIAIACNPQTRTVAADGDERNRLVQDPGIGATQSLASPRVTTGRVTCVMSGPKARVSSQFASHAHCGHRSPSWLFLFCGV